MKKKIVFLVMLMTNLNIFAIGRTNGSMNVSLGAEVKIPIDGKIYQIGNKNLPQFYNVNTIVLDITKTYYFDSKKNFADYQIIISGVELSNEIKNTPVGTELKSGTEIGKAIDSPIILNIRCKTFDVYLADVSDVPPEFEDDWYYFGVGMFLPTSPKYLDYQPINSKEDEIEFWDYPDSFENLYKQAIAPTTDGNNVYMSSFPAFQVCLKTKFEKYPVSRVQQTTIESLIVGKFFMNCSHMLSYKFDSIPMRLYFQKGFDQYLEKEYKLGEDIYIYLTVILFTNNEFYCYVRDFSLKSPDEMSSEKVERAKKFMNEDFTEN